MAGCAQFMHTRTLSKTVHPSFPVTSIAVFLLLQHYFLVPQIKSSG
jgi:hypothetical protein